MKTAIVTGGANGIGLSICKALAKKNFSVISLDIKDPVEIVDHVSHFICDIRNTKDIGFVIKEIQHVDLLVNNAAVQYEEPFINQKEEMIKDVINTNLIGTLMMTQTVIKKMTEGSQIINIGSVHGDIPRKNKLVYDVSKAGLNMMTKSLALELAPQIRVNQLNIGATFTPMNKSFTEHSNVVEEAKKKVPLKHIFSPDEIAHVVIQLIGNDFKFMTGSILTYDGGRSLV